EEQALESHEVIELQAFSERKDWITEKIKFLEAMPPIELFAGLDAVRLSAPVVHGLPSREELKKWVSEHDKIEKETEIFDSGELKKFKKFTKAASKRNLSPQDTDLIELTLTTILEFDKLLHLLRDRSEHLDMLNVRLTWEEHRNAAWSDRSRILEDLKTFLASRARWSVTGYETSVVHEEPSPRRRGSVASVASDTSSLSLPSFSRTARYKLAESLSREAAQFSSRITSLRHGRVAAAGKALDKLIDHSRTPVPDELLDEQDKLEEQGITEMEGVGKFIMEVVMQWRKADEFYVETLKDQSAAQQLLDDIYTAKLSHPSQRQDALLSSRAGVIARRLGSRDLPSSPSSLFPRPRHPLFPEQLAANLVIVRTLDDELSSALSIVQSIEDGVRDYHAACEAVKTVDSNTSTAVALAERYTSVLERLRNGVDATDADGTPLDLCSTNCLSAMSHSAYLALLPTLLHDLAHLDETARNFLPKSRNAISGLVQFAIDVEYKKDASAAIDRLSTVMEEAVAIRADVEAQVRALRETRRIWSVAESILQDLVSIKSDIDDASQRLRWRPPSSLPTTPESFPSPLPSSTPLDQYAVILDSLQSRLTTDVQGVMPSLFPLIPSVLSEYLSHRCTSLSQALGQVKRILQSTITIEAQTSSLSTLRDEAFALRQRIDGVQDSIAHLLDVVLRTTFAPDNWNASQIQLDAATAECEKLTESLVNDIPRRIPFHAGLSWTSPPNSPRRRRTAAPSDMTLDALPTFLPLESPVDLARLDDIVRSECNTLSMHLSGDMAALTRSASRLRLALRAREFRQDLESVGSSIDTAERALQRYREAVGAITLSSDAGDAYGAVAAEVSHALATHSEDLSGMLKAVQDRLSSLLATCRRDEDPSADDIVSPLAHSLDDLRTRYSTWADNFKTIQDWALALQVRAKELLEKRREEERLKLEAEQERQRQEAERILEEKRKERERIEDEERQAREQEEREAREAQEKRDREEQEEREKREREARDEQERLEKETREEETKREHAAREVREQKEREIRVERERLEEMARKEREKRERVEQEWREMKAQKQAERLEAEARRAREEQERLRVSEEQRLRDEAEGAQLFSFTRHDQLNIALDTFGTPENFKSATRAGFASLAREIHGLRERLRDLDMKSLARPSASAGTSTLPSQGRMALISAQFSELVSQVNSLPPRVHYVPIDAELRSLRFDIAATETLLHRVHELSAFVNSVQECDASLSDLLEHVDSFPNLPMGPLSSNHTSSIMDTPEEQLSSRIDFTRSLVNYMETEYAKVADDHRALSERVRIMQTWQELEAMASDRVHGQKSRPPSAVSSGRNSRSSTDGVRPGSLKKKASHYSTLSVGSPRTVGKFLSPGPAHPSSLPRRSTSQQPSRSASQQPRPPSVASVVSSRSTSGPLFSPSGRLFNSTFASRQRTTSLSSNASATPVKIPPSRARAQSNHRYSRVDSPTLSDASTSSRSFNTLSRSTHSRSTNMHSTWSRTPRLSFPSTPISPSKSRLPIRTRKTYVANPKNRLDVAVGDIVNSLAVDIDIEAAEDSWQDQSGKYWIGTDEPKLCFCRILRSQTVMVRVGGGWQELSKFIQTHFADSFRLLPDTTMSFGSREEKWISSATLMEAPEIVASPPRPPKTPEPSGIPSFALSTPSGRSPHSIKSSPSSGSPLTPLQFMRRADMDSIGARPSTPSKTSTMRPRQLPIGTPRVPAPVWKP
ncbi:hypothetical protein K488DRAFT_23218, partial [Vararia minispora EC-137]